MTTEERLTRLARVAHLVLYHAGSPDNPPPIQGDQMYRERVERLRGLVRAELAGTGEGCAMYGATASIAPEAAIATLEVEDTEGEPINFEAVREALAGVGAKLVTWSPGRRMLAVEAFRRAVDAINDAWAIATDGGGGE